MIVAVAVPLADVALPHFNETQLFTDSNYGRDFAQAWERWDSVWYLQIVTDGYRYTPTDTRSNVAFFPLYPLVVAAVAPLVRSADVAGLLVSNLAFFAALVLLYRLTELKLGAAAAGRTVFYIAAFPWAFLFSAIYAESLFMLLMITAFYAAEREQWAWAGIAGMFGAAARPTGILIALALGLLWLSKSGWSLRTALRNWRPLLWLALIPLGLLAYMLLLYVRFGDPLAFVVAQLNWNARNNSFQVLVDIRLLLQGKLWPSFIVDLASFFWAMAMVIPVTRRLGVAYGVYTLLSILIPVTDGVISMTRFVQAMFPLFMILGLWGRHHWLDVLLRVVYLALLPMTTILFLKWVFLT